MTARNVHLRPLTELQQAIVELLWSNGPANAEQVRQGLLPRYRLKDSTLRTLLRRLEARGHLAHRDDGKVFTYEATTSPTRLAAYGVRQIIDRFWSGSVERFLHGMVDEKILTRADIARLAKTIAHGRPRNRTEIDK